MLYKASLAIRWNSRSVTMCIIIFIVRRSNNEDFGGLTNIGLRRKVEITWREERPIDCVQIRNYIYIYI